MTSSGISTFRPDRLREARERAGLSPEQLGVLAGVSPETARRAEGARGHPNARVARALAQALGVELDHLAPPARDLTLGQARQRTGRTQREIARALGMSVQMVSAVERGVYRARQPDRWAAAYRMSRKRWWQAWETGRQTRIRAMENTQRAGGA
ncbi:helix-turn-helix transcriptional regulator [Streptomyces sp. GKU 257-1]|nr:helix-turn-helix transcriptional regulator [Streptomyces sp. GKU 257-1]